MLKLAYCDKIADTIRKSLIREVNDNWASNPLAGGDVGTIEWDLDANGAFNSPKKMLKVYDGNGKAYVVTIEEAPMLDLED